MFNVLFLQVLNLIIWDIVLNKQHNDLSVQVPHFISAHLNYVKVPDAFRMVTFVLHHTPPNHSRIFWQFFVYWQKPFDSFVPDLDCRQLFQSKWLLVMEHQIRWNAPNSIRKILFSSNISENIVFVSKVNCWCIETPGRPEILADSGCFQGRIDQVFVLSFIEVSQKLQDFLSTDGVEFLGVESVPENSFFHLGLWPP